MFAGHADRVRLAHQRHSDRRLRHVRRRDARQLPPAAHRRARSPASGCVPSTSTGARSRATAVIENSYADVKNVVVTSGDSTMHVDGRFSLGFPRRDGGEEINARIRDHPAAASRICGTPSTSTTTTSTAVSRASSTSSATTRRRSASARWRSPRASRTASRSRRRPRRCGSKATASASTTSSIVKGGGRGTGAAYVGWNGTYSFNLDAQRIPVESRRPRAVAERAAAVGPPRLHRRRQRHVRRRRATTCAARSATSSSATKASARSSATSTSTATLLTLKLEAASPRLAVSGSGTHRAERRDGCGAHVQRGRHVARSVPPRVQSRSSRRTPPPSPAATSASSASWPTSITCWSRRPSNARPAPLRLPAAQRDADPRWRSIATRCASPTCG